MDESEVESSRVENASALTLHPEGLVVRNAELANLAIKSIKANYEMSMADRRIQELKRRDFKTSLLLNAPGKGQIVLYSHFNKPLRTELSQDEIDAIVAD